MRRVPPAKRYSRLFLPLIFLAACLINTVAVVAVVEQPCAPRRPCPSNAAEAGELVMPGKRKRCFVCPTPHDLKSPDKGRMGKPVSSEQAHELLSTIPGAGGAEPWTSTDGDCYTFGSHVLMNTPGQLPAQRGDEIMACSAGYQARTSLHIKLQEDRALKVRGVGCGMRGTGCRVQGAGCRVPCVGCGVGEWDVGGPGSRVQDPAQGLGFRVYQGLPHRRRWVQTLNPEP